mmetsp:Transcript_21930/g.83471  ORF Transcript_21930/g.83471 Transcript_21930/m.83471 type:complete len:401 (+) Transcript_21930:1662-2864(+)
MDSVVGAVVSASPAAGGLPSLLAVPVAPGSPIPSPSPCRKLSIPVRRGKPRPCELAADPTSCAWPAPRTARLLTRLGLLVDLGWLPAARTAPPAQCANLLPRPGSADPGPLQSSSVSFTTSSTRTAWPVAAAAWASPSAAPAGGWVLESVGDAPPSLAREEGTWGAASDPLAAEACPFPATARLACQLRTDAPALPPLCDRCRPRLATEFEGPAWLGSAPIAAARLLCSSACAPPERAAPRLRSVTARRSGDTWSPRRLRVEGPPQEEVELESIAASGGGRRTLAPGEPLAASPPAETPGATGGAETSEAAPPLAPNTPPAPPPPAPTPVASLGPMEGDAAPPKRLGARWGEGQGPGPLLGCLTPSSSVPRSGIPPPSVPLCKWAIRVPAGSCNGAGIAT